jgi:hypothetical protein
MKALLPFLLPSKRMLTVFRSTQILSLGLCIIALTANSAWAANWVQDPADTAGFTWIDMDSIEVRDGLTHYKAGYSWSNGVPPPADADRLKDAINCTTGEYFRWFQSESRWVNKRVGYGSHQGIASYDESGALRTLICNR